MSRWMVLGWCLLVSTLSVQAQYPMRVSAGLSTFWINGANPARETLAFLGGGFSGAQSGVAVKLAFPEALSVLPSLPLDVVLFAETIFFRGRERYPYPNANLYRSFGIDVASLSVGLERTFVHFSSLTSAFAGMEIRGTLVSRGLFEQRFVRLNGEIIERNTYTVRTKTTAWRLGLTMRVGVRGKFDPDFAMEASIGYSALNLLGRQPERGELLTPDPTLEVQERIVAGVVSSIMILYYWR